MQQQDKNLKCKSRHGRYCKGFMHIMLMSSLLHLISDRGDSPEHEFLTDFCLQSAYIFVRFKARWITYFLAILGTMTETDSCLHSETASDPVSIQDDTALAAVS